MFLTGASIIVIFELSGTTNFFQLSRPPYRIGVIISGAGALASVVLTGGLLYLYDKQREILNEQKKLSEYQQSALLKIKDHRLIPYEETKEFQEEEYTDPHRNLTLYQSEYIEIDLSNIGRAPAYDLRIELYVTADGESYSGAPPLVDGDYKSVISGLRGREIDTIFHNPEGNSIQSESGDARTFTVPMITLNERIPYTWKENSVLHRFPPASSIFRCAKSSLDSSISAYLLLWYKDGRGNQGPNVVRMVNISPDDLTDLDDIDVEGDDSVIDQLPDLNDLFEEHGDSVAEPVPDLDHPSDR